DRMVDLLSELRPRSLEEIEKEVALARVLSQHRPGFKMLKPPEPEEDLRGFEWHYLWGLCHSDIRTLRGSEDYTPFYGVAYSPDGWRLAAGSRDRLVRVWDAQTGQEIFTLKGHQGPVASVAFSPDGRRLASAGGESGARQQRLPGSIKVWDLQTGQAVLT